MRCKRADASEAAREEVKVSSEQEQSKGRGRTGRETRVQAYESKDTLGLGAAARGSHVWVRPRRHSVESERSSVHAPAMSTQVAEAHTPKRRRFENTASKHRLRRPPSVFGQPRTHRLRLLQQS